MIIPRILFFALAGLLFSSTLHAQFELKGGVTNALDPRLAGASATVTGGSVTSITVQGGGGGYTTIPNVTIEGLATASVTLTGGRVTAVTIINGGSGYNPANPPFVKIDPPNLPGSAPFITNVQFAGYGVTGASSARTIVNPAGAASQPVGNYPAASALVNGIAVIKVSLHRSTFGNAFASGVPRYFMGDVIVPPSLTWSGQVDGNGSYWRPMPLQSGEVIPDAYLVDLDGAAQPLVPTFNVVVTQSSTSSSAVIVASVPDTLSVGAILLGREVQLINGNTVSLSGSANQNIAANVSVIFNPYQPFYYSPHADKVFATQTGRVSLTWVSALPDPSDGKYRFRSEVFSVSSASQVAPRVIYWTEKSFDGPLVRIPTGRIVRVNPAFNTFVPGQAPEYTPLGGSANPNPGATAPGEPRTLWFEDTTGLPALHAYNVEGRVFVEYLGPEDQSNPGVHEFLGADIVEISRSATAETISTPIGDQLRPRQEPKENGDDQMVATLANRLGTGGKPLFGTFMRPDGLTDYYAERANNNPDLMSIYWSDKFDASLYSKAGGAVASLEISWPISKRNYLHIWPSDLASYEPINVSMSDGWPAVGPKFVAASLPQLVFQDDPAELETEIDGANQSLMIDLRNSSDLTNRSLLKFSSAAGPQYLRLYIQSEGTLGSAAVPAVLDPDGDGPLTGTPGSEAVYTLNDLNGDGVRDQLNLAATVGSRINAPSTGYAIAGHISSGTCYSPLAYIDPRGSEGFSGAAGGAIIPVNALAGDNDLTVWWYKKVEFAAATKLEPFYVPAISAHYTVSYPDVATMQPLVIASNLGLENPSLTSLQKAGSLYVQNDPAEIGYNPNEEHALMLAGNVYALRVDLNQLTSSAPCVLIQYADSDGRPSMRVAAVFDETPTYPLEYQKIAGTPMVAPTPLGLLPIPRLANGTVANQEVVVAPDVAPWLSLEEFLPETLDALNRFTIADRKGQHWLMRGAHAGGDPSFGIKYYYYVRDGFAFPGKASPPAVGAIQPFIGDMDGNGLARTVTYLPVWPDDTDLPVAQRKDVPELLSAQTLTKARASNTKGNLPQVMGQTSAQILYQQSIANLGGDWYSSVALHDPIAAKMTLLSEGALAKLPGSVKTTDYAGKTYFQGLPPNLQNRFYFDGNQGTLGGLVLLGEFVDVEVGEDYLNLNQLTAQDITDLKAVCAVNDGDKGSWDAAIQALSLTMETFRENPAVPETYIAVRNLSRNVRVDGRANISDPDTAVAAYALSSTGRGVGYVTLMFGNGEAFTDPGDPVTMEIIKVIPDLFPGDLKVLLSSNPLDEKVVLRHSGDYGGHPENFEFRWRYAFNTSAGAAPISDKTSGPDWINPDLTNKLSSTILVGADPSAVLSDPAVLMGDVNFTMSYRLKVTGQADDAGWSDWTGDPDTLVEGWIKRVLAKITPFNQRMTDLYSNSLNTDVSLITQAGSRWEGNIALNLENINDSGLIEIYETVLNRGKDFTIQSNVDTPATSNALILAAGYLNDLYTILGNEAYADAANPTISIDDQGSALEVNTSRFAFEGQVASSLDEELALLRGRDDFASPGTNLAPAYNRLWWNYTRGINSGEALYAVNYNITEKAGSSTANGIVDAADAYRMFPQAHGDAYGHYLTALTGYYKLLTHPYFTWTPSAEAVNILGVAVNVDYKDERKFAVAAANVGRTAQQILALERRRSYQDDPNVGWKHLRDGKVNPRNGKARNFGVDETASRATQGAFFHWITGNAVLPDKDPNPDHTGVQVVDRTTVLELPELPALANSFQTTMDSANARLNPLGLSPGAIAFDLDPYFNNSLGQELADPDVVGKSHYEQMSGRALRALNNAAGSFNQAATMTRLLRNQENDVSDLQQTVVDEEVALRGELFALYGKPYAGDIGPGKLYPQGYDDPDFYRWMIIDRPLDWIDTTAPKKVTYRVNKVYRTFTGGNFDQIVAAYNNTDPAYIEDMDYMVTPNQFAQFADVVGPGTALGKRSYVGALQEALVEAQLAHIAILAANDDLDDLKTRFNREKEVLDGLVIMQTGQQATTAVIGTALVVNETAAAVLESIAEASQVAGEIIGDIAGGSSALLPMSVGLANDVTSVGRGGIKIAAGATKGTMLAGAAAANSSARLLRATLGGGLELIKENVLMSLGFSQDQLQAAYEFEQTYRDLIGMYTRFTELSYQYSTATQKISNLVADGEMLKLRRESNRKRAAGVINGYRTQDLTFRTFRNEALVQYRTLFDLASRYSYLSAKAYDYETGLLGTPQGQAVINRLVSSRSLGDLTGGVPQATTSTLGDAGLAGTMAQLNADFAVAEGRLGINNPDHYNTLFSLRQELFRLLPEGSGDNSQNEAWQQTLEQHIVPNVLADPHVAAYCRGLTKLDGSRVPGIIIPFSTGIHDSQNFFKLPLAAGDHTYSPSSFSTKIAAAGLAFEGYVGTLRGESTEQDALSATPFVYLIPCGTDFMRDPMGDTGAIRSWQVVDQALPMPYNLGASSFNSNQFFSANGSLSEQPWVIRKHQAFRAVADPSLFEAGDLPIVYSNARLIGRSVWNSQWKIVIPANTLLDDEQKGLTNFVKSVKDIHLFLRTYSNSGN